jgi:hypothetical protein
MELLKQGRIVRHPYGHYVGWTIRIENDPAGFLILLIKNPSDRRSEGYDRWAANECELDAQLKGWVVEWESKAKG